MLTQFYRLRHKPTGLYYSPTHSGSSNLSTKGKIYSTGNNLINFLSGCSCSLEIINQKTIKENYDVLKSIGEIKTHKYYGGKVRYSWKGTCHGSDFEIETITFAKL